MLSVLAFISFVDFNPIDSPQLIEIWVLGSSFIFTTTTCTLTPLTIFALLVPGRQSHPATSYLQLIFASPSCLYC